MTDNKPVRKNLSLGATVSPMSNYIGKAPALQSGVGDSMLRLAKNLESYNPALKTLAEEHEKKRMEEGYAKAMKFAEETGALKEHQTLWNEYQAKNPEMTSFNPYLKEFLDGKTAENLTLQRDNFMKLAYVQEGWAGLNNEAYQKAVAEKNAAWHKANKGTFDSLDSLVVAKTLDKATPGMFASLNTEHLKAKTEQVIKQRATALQNDTSFFIKDDLREITDGFNSNKVDIFHLSSQTEENNGTLAGIVRNSNLMRNLNELLGNYENQGMTREEGIQTILATLKNHAVNNPDAADEMIIFGKEFAKDSPTISKEVMETWARETEIAAIAEANRQDKIGFQQDENEQKQLIIDVRDAINALSPAQMEGKTGQELMVLSKRPDGSAFPSASISLFNTHATALNEGSKTTETERQIDARNDIEYSIHTSNIITRQGVYDAVTSGVVHSSRLNFLLNLMDEKEKDGGVAFQKKQQIRETAIKLAVAYVEEVGGDKSKRAAINVTTYANRRLDELDKELGRDATSYEAEDFIRKQVSEYVKLPMFKNQDISPYNDWYKRNTELVLDDPSLGKVLMGHVTKDGEVTDIKTMEELGMLLRTYKEHPETMSDIIYKAYGVRMPDEYLPQIYEEFKKPVMKAIKMKLQTYKIPLTPERREELRSNYSTFEAEGDKPLNHSEP